MVPKPFSEAPATDEPMAPTVIVVTPYSTGCCVAKAIQERGYKLICLWTSWFCDNMKTHVPKSVEGLKWDIVLDEQETIEATANLVRKEAADHGMELVSLVCGGEAGVDLADALSEYMGFLSNGTAIPNRRDKKVQQELIKAKGLRSIRQVSGTSFTKEVQEFLETETYPVIIKPLDSAGSDGVKKCETYEEAKSHFLYLLNDHIMVNSAAACDEVLCQEFLKGTEYVVDHVSRDGVHKTMMVWRYDKRPVNGASFVYFGDIPVDMETEEAKMLIPYARGVLDAMDVRHGPSHGEIILTKDGPCLVEMNCRANGGDGIWQQLCRTMTGGFNQVDGTVTAYLDPEKFNQLPDRPASPFKTHGQIVDLVSFKGGTIKAIPGYNVIRLLPSFVQLETHFQIGVKVSPTVDMATEAGTLIVMNDDKDALEQDINLIRQMEKTGVLFQTEEEDQKIQQVIEHPSFKLLDPNSRADSMSFGKKKFTMLDSNSRANSLGLNPRRQGRTVPNDSPNTFMAAQHL